MVYVPYDGKEVKDIFRHPGGCVMVGSARKRALAAQGVGAQQWVLV